MQQQSTYMYIIYVKYHKVLQSVLLWYNFYLKTFAVIKDCFDNFLHLCT